MPTSSILNVDQAGQTRAAAGIFPVSDSGVALFISGGGHIVVDLLGYFTGPSAAAGTDGLYTAFDPTRLLDTRGTSPLGNGVPLYPGGGLELAVSQGGSMAYNVTSVEGVGGFVTAFPAGTARPNTSTCQLDRWRRHRRQLRHHPGLQPRPRLLQPIADPSTRRPAGLVLRSVRDGGAAPTPPNTAPAPTRHLLGVQHRRSVVAQRHSNSRRCGAACPQCCGPGVRLLLRVAAGAGECRNGPLGERHSRRRRRLPDGREPGLGLRQLSVAADLAVVRSAPHLANIKNAIYGSAGLGFVVRTNADGSQVIFGSTVFATC